MRSHWRINRSNRECNDADSDSRSTAEIVDLGAIQVHTTFDVTSKSTLECGFGEGGPSTGSSFKITKKVD